MYKPTRLQKKLLYSIKCYQNRLYCCLTHQVSKVYPGEDLNATTDKVSKGTSYIFRVHASNNIGNSSYLTSAEVLADDKYSQYFPYFLHYFCFFFPTLFEFSSMNLFCAFTSSLSIILCRLINIYLTFQNLRLLALRQKLVTSLNRHVSWRGTNQMTAEALLMVCKWIYIIINSQKHVERLTF